MKKTHVSFDVKSYQNINNLLESIRNITAGLPEKVGDQIPFEKLKDLRGAISMIQDNCGTLNRELPNVRVWPKTDTQMNEENPEVTCQGNQTRLPPPPKDQDSASVNFEEIEDRPEKKFTIMRCNIEGCIVLAAKDPGHLHTVFDDEMPEILLLSRKTGILNIATNITPDIKLLDGLKTGYECDMIKIHLLPDFKSFLFLRKILKKKPIERNLALCKRLMHFSPQLKIPFTFADEKRFIIIGCFENLIIASDGVLDELTREKLRSDYDRNKIETIPLVTGDFISLFRKVYNRDPSPIPQKNRIQKTQTIKDPTQEESLAVQKAIESDFPNLYFSQVFQIENPNRFNKFLTICQQSKVLPVYRKDETAYVLITERTTEADKKRFLLLMQDPQISKIVFWIIEQKIFDQVCKKMDFLENLDVEKFEIVNFIHTKRIIPFRFPNTGGRVQVGMLTEDIERDDLWDMEVELQGSSGIYYHTAERIEVNKATMDALLERHFPRK